MKNKYIYVRNSTDMIYRYFILIVCSVNIIGISCNRIVSHPEQNIIFLHHSTGEHIWYGDKISLITKAINKVNGNLADKFGQKARLPQMFKAYNKDENKNYAIKEMEFPKASPYGWNNYPFDYYNIWVKNAGEDQFIEEPTLEILTKEYNVIIFKHCFPVSNIEPDRDSADINSYTKTIANYKLQYIALREKLLKFPNTKFILFTGAAQVKTNINEGEAKRAQEFFSWVKEYWDLPDDNIFIWDFYILQTEGGLYFKDEYAVSTTDSHPNGEFARKTVKLLFNRIIDVIENNGTGTNLKGELKREGV